MFCEQLILDNQLSPAKRSGANTMATGSNSNSGTSNHHDDRPPGHNNVAKQQVMMRRDPNEPREQKERPLSISQRIKQLQMNAGLDKEAENTHKHMRRQVSRPITTIGNVK